MNKIIVEENKISSNFPLLNNNFNITLENMDLIIEYKNSNINLIFNINENVNIFELFNNSNCNNTYNLKKESNLRLDRFSIDCSIKTNINLDYKANLLYKYSHLNKSNNDYEINVYHNYPDTTSKLINYGINFTNNKLNFLINSYIKKQSINSNAIQDNKIIEIANGSSIIKPNLIIDNNEISCSHSCFIGDFNKDDIFYMQSRGISYDDIKKLLSKSFLIGNLNIDDENLDIVLKELNRIWG